MDGFKPIQFESNLIRFNMTQTTTQFFPSLFVGYLLYYNTLIVTLHLLQSKTVNGNHNYHIMAAKPNVDIFSLSFFSCFQSIVCNQSIVK